MEELKALWLANNQLQALPYSLVELLASTSCYLDLEGNPWAPPPSPSPSASATTSPPSSFFRLAPSSASSSSSSPQVRSAHFFMTSLLDLCLTCVSRQRASAKQSATSKKEDEEEEEEQQEEEEQEDEELEEEEKEEEEERREVLPIELEEMISSNKRTCFYCKQPFFGEERVLVLYHNVPLATKHVVAERRFCTLSCYRQHSHLR
ncbi:Supervillin d [Balamuthia mandrillaris]